MRRPLSALLLFALLIVVAGCATPAPSQPTPAAVQEWPQGREFRVTAITDGGVDHPLVAGTEMTVRFGQPGELQVYAGCNQLGVHARLDGNRLAVDDYVSTAIACPSAEMAQDAWLIQFFNANPVWEQVGDVVTMRASETVVTLAATGR